MNTPDQSSGLPIHPYEVPTMLHLQDKTSEFRTATILLIFNLWQTFCAKYVGIFTIHFHTDFRMHISSGLLVTSLKPKGLEWQLYYCFAFCKGGLKMLHIIGDLLLHKIPGTYIKCCWTVTISGSRPTTSCWYYWGGFRSCLWLTVLLYLRYTRIYRRCQLFGLYLQRRVAGLLVNNDLKKCARNIHGKIWGMVLSRCVPLEAELNISLRAEIWIQVPWIRSRSFIHLTATIGAFGCHSAGTYVCYVSIFDISGTIGIELKTFWILKLQV
jgi:hypothetical protein